MQQTSRPEQGVKCGPQAPGSHSKPAFRGTGKILVRWVGEGEDRAREGMCGAEVTLAKAFFVPLLRQLSDRERWGVGADFLPERGR